MSLTHKFFRVEPIPPPNAFAWQLETDPLVFQPGPLFITASQSNSVTDHGSNPRPRVTNFLNSDEFVIVVEDLMFPTLKTTRTQTKLVDSDSTY